MPKTTQSGKLGSVISEGHEVTGDNFKSHLCKNCGKLKLDGPRWQCRGCKAVEYCDRHCEKEHWPMHKQLCCAIQELSRAEEANNSAHDESGHFISHLMPKQRFVGLVGNKCTVNCILNGKVTEALWDTGAQVSIISARFLDKTFLDLEGRAISELIEADLSLTAANGSPIKYIGWVQLDLNYLLNKTFCMYHF